MNHDDAEEYTQALGQVVAGGYRQIALGKRLGVPAALDMSVEEWVETRLGGYVRMSIPDRREAVAELVVAEMSNVEIAEVLGVDEGTVRNDRKSFQSESSEDESPSDGLTAPIASTDSELSDFVASPEDESELVESQLFAAVDETTKVRDAKLIALLSKAVAATGALEAAQEAVTEMLARVERDRLATLAPSLERKAAMFAALSTRARDLERVRPHLVEGGQR